MASTDECSSMEDQLYTDLSGSFPGGFRRSGLFENENKLVANTSAGKFEGEVWTTRSHEKPQTAGRVLGHRRDLSQRVKPALKKRKAVIPARSSHETQDSECEYFYGVSTKNAFSVLGEGNHVYDTPKSKKQQKNKQQQGRLAHTRA